MVVRGLLDGRAEGLIPDVFTTMSSVPPMKLPAVVLLVSVALLSACGKQDAPGVSQVEEASPPAAEVQSGEAPLPVAGGLRLAFDHSVSSRREIENEDGSTNHILRVVYRDTDEAIVASGLEAAFRSRQWRVSEASRDGSAVTYIARGEGAQRVRYVLTPAGADSQVEGLTPNTRGMVTFYWKE